MVLERFYDDNPSQARYLIACQACGEAPVLDPRRDIKQYLDLTKQCGPRILAVTVSYPHADFPSGTCELAAATGAVVYGPAPAATTGSTASRPNAWVTTALSSWAAAPSRPAISRTALLNAPRTWWPTAPPRPNPPTRSAATVFSEDQGRPGLLDEAVGMQRTRVTRVEYLLAWSKNVVLTLLDQVQVFPGHGSGAACGKAIGALPSTTVGYERHFAWWRKHLKDDGEQGFIDELFDPKTEGAQPMVLAEDAEHAAKYGDHFVVRRRR